ncbi:MAG: hypothetical protein ACRDD7_01765 [Peptostreptococcaceae bacterium]
MKDFYILNSLDLFKGVYKRLGINYEIMRLIIQSKLIMDGRRGQSTLNQEEYTDKNTFYTSLIIYALIGLASAPIIAIDINPVVKMSMYFSFFMIMILSVFISDFSSVILDINDKDIIVTKGVDIKTLNAAKITHIFIYISLLSIAISGAGLIAGIRYGFKFLLLFLGSIFLIDILMIIITALMYFVIIKIFNGEKLKDVINAFQIVFLLVFVVGYQFVARAFTFINMDFIYEPKLWNVLLPPMWFSSNFNLLYGNVDNITIIMSILSIIVPILSLLLYIKVIPIFENNLQKLGNNTYKNTKLKEKLYKKVSKKICENQEEKVFFNFTYDILSKDREFKTQIYPSLATGAFMPFIMMMSMYDGEGILNYINSLIKYPYYLYGYLCVLMSQTIMTTLKFSSEYQASWIYDVLPIKDEENVYKGMFKASIYKLILPVFVIMGIGFIIIFKLQVVIHLMVMFLGVIITSMMSIKFNDKILPFSCEYKNTNSTSNIIIMFKSMFVVGIVCLIHFLVSKNLIFTMLYLVLLAIFIKLNFKKSFKIN